MDVTLILFIVTIEVNIITPIIHSLELWELMLELYFSPTQVLGNKPKNKSKHYGFKIGLNSNIDSHY